MKTPEEILKPFVFEPASGGEVVHTDHAIKAMEEYAIQSVDCACANAVLQMETLEAENRAHIDAGKEEIHRLQAMVKSLQNHNVDIERKFKDADNRCREMGIKNAECWDKINQLDRERKEYRTLFDEYKARYDYAVIDGTDLRGKLEQQDDRFDQLDGEYQDLVRICTAIYRLDKHVLKAMVNESLGGDNYEKFKDHLGV